MPDIDDELLALAGGDSEDEASLGSKRSPQLSPRDSAQQSRTRRQPSQDGSAEEGEASPAPSSPDSLQSASMDESDSDAEQAPSESRPPLLAADGNEKYPVDGMFMSQAEKAEVMAMREVEREQILADRISEIERQRQNRLLRQMVTNAEIEERKYVKKKRSAESADLDDGQRKTTRQRTGKASEVAMDSLRRARAEKQRRKEGRDLQKDGFSPRRGSRRADGEDEDGSPEAEAIDAEPAKTVAPAQLHDYERVRLGRNEFAQVCFTPGFEEAITGCFIRISVGAHPETGIEQYRMAAIRGFTTNRPYALSGPSGPFVTDLYVKAAHGKAVKEFPFIAASSGKFTEVRLDGFPYSVDRLFGRRWADGRQGELNRFQVTCQNEGVKLPSKSFLEDKVDEINSLIKHKWTSEEIKARLARRNELKRRFDPAERERVAQLLDEAVSRGDEKRAQELQEELEKLSSQRLAFRTTLGAPKTGDPSAGSSEQDRLAERNRENRRVNAELVRKAQLKEKAKVREIEMAIKRGEQVPDDPSRRLRTKAKFVHDINEGSQPGPRNGETVSTPVNGTPRMGPTKPQMATHLAKLQEKSYDEAKGLPTIHKPLMDDDVIGALDLDIDVEI